MWIVGRCILYTEIRLLLLIHSFISSFFFLSNYQTLNIFITFFSGTVRSRRLKLGTHVDSGQMYRVYTGIGLLLLICPFISSFFFLSNFQTLKFFVTRFSQTVRPIRVETWYTHGQWVDVRCILESGCCCLFISYVLFFSFFPIFKH